MGSPCWPGLGQFGKISFVLLILIQIKKHSKYKNLGYVTTCEQISIGIDNVPIFRDKLILLVIFHCPAIFRQQTMDFWPPSSPGKEPFGNCGQRACVLIYINSLYIEIRLYPRC